MRKLLKSARYLELGVVKEPGFLWEQKWGFMPCNAPVQKYVICNSDESELGTCKDRETLRNNSHQ